MESFTSQTDEEAYETGKMLGRREGLLVGISAGAAVKAAIEHPEVKILNCSMLLNHKKKKSH